MPDVAGEPVDTARHESTLELLDERAPDAVPTIWQAYDEPLQIAPVPISRPDNHADDLASNLGEQQELRISLQRRYRALTLTFCAIILPSRLV